ncbi:cilia- and flagella-associated protein 61-like [Thrips palmi]|uniref:Cilia- and flagella-associated protein 61-like n=1 Tax=Thrips palmi TaxID=161013 RepID=A0A6P8YW61_THRPL|nr:cilia- and flagella-associated protein 61-like [Thrips palmi]
MSIFGEVEDIPSMLERGVLSLSQLNVREELVACLCLSNWPPSPGVHPSASPEWLNPLYELQLSPARTMHVRLLLWHDRYALTCARLLLHSVFVTLPALEQLVLVVPAKTPKNDVLWSLFDEELAKGFKTATNLQSLLICRREFFVRKLRLRPAVCEDNDDLLRIFDQKAYRLRQLYGDFNIAELISNPESRQIIVAEGPKRQTKVKQAWEMRVPVIGVMVLDSNVNLPLLNAHFQLLPFYGLRQPHTRDVLNLAGWVKPRPEMAEALHTAQQAADESDEPATLEEDSSSGTSTSGPRRVEGLAARAARLKEEALERKRRRWTGAEHYLSAISLTEEERLEPEDPYRLADVTWANVQAGTESSSLDTESMDSDDGRIFRFHRKKKVRVRTRSDMMVANKGVIELLPEFRGPANAFLVELFVIDQLFDERLALDFLAEAFRIFSGLDYCTLAVPHAFPTFPLLDNFVRVAPRERRHFHQELYVAHRSAVLGYRVAVATTVKELEVREAVPADLQDVLQLIRTLKRSLGLVLREVQAALGVEEDHSGWLKAYVACWQDQVVGLAVISDEDDWEYMACHYTVGRFADVSLLGEADHGGLRVCLLSPVFQQRAGLFLRELHRLSAKTLLYYTLYPCADLWRADDKAAKDADVADARAGQACPLFLHKQAPAAAEQPTTLPCLAVPSILDELMPVAPRPPPNGLHQVVVEQLEEGEPLSASDRREPPYALFLSTPRLVALPKATVNVRVVVVGASDTALSFLETLVFSAPEVRYNNLTLVSAHGLRGETDLGPLADRFLPHRGRYDYRQLARLQLGAWVNVVTGMVTKIHRAERIVEVDGKTALPYDYLFLFCGQQFCLPKLDLEEDLPCKHYPTGKGWPASIG